MRDLMFLFGFLALLPLALGNAFVAYLIWGWTALIAIDSYMYGFMQDIRLNLIFALIALSLIIVKRDKVRGSSLKQSGTLILLLLFAAQATVSAICAYDGNTKNWELYDKILKSLLFAMVMPLVVVGRYRIHAMVVMICLGLAFHGLLDGLKFMSSAGNHNAHGLVKFGDNNHYAVMMVMAIPLLLYLGQYMSHRLMRWGMMFVALLVVAAVIATHSRGGLISLIAMGAWLVFTSRQRFRGILMFAAGIGLVLAMAPESWMNRMDTIKSAEEDSSFMSRVEAWQVSSAIALHNPLTGGGLHAVQVQSVWAKFRGQTGLLPFVETVSPSEIFRAAHSIYFEVMGDLGFVGFALFLGIVINGILNGRRLEALVGQRHAEYAWAIDMSRTLSAVIFGFLVGGASVSLAYSEVIYVVVMLSEILRREVAQSMGAPITREAAGKRVHT